jgi:hypothetical protein
MEIILTLHSYLRWVVVFFALSALIRAFSGMNAHTPFAEADRKGNLFLMIACDIQLLLGLILYFVKGWAGQLSSPDVMKNAGIRQFAIEHIFGMIIALALVHVAYSRAKRGIGTAVTHKKVLTLLAIAILIIMATIPWATRPMFR